MNPSLRNCPGLGRIDRAAAFAFCVMALQPAFADTEQWIGVPGVSASLNWTDASNWSGPQQTYYNQVQFRGIGANPNNDFSVNNILDSATGVAQMPIWQLDFCPTNGNYTTLINPGVTLQVGAGNGRISVGADILNTGSPAPANAVETITILGPGATLSMAGSLYVSQGSVAPEDAHNVTFDLSGLDHFINNGPANGANNSIYVGANAAARSHGVLYLAKTNSITLGNQFQIGQNASSSNSLPAEVYLGIVNSIALGSGNLIVGGNGCTTAGAWIKFNPAFIGGDPVPSAFFSSTNSSGRINNFFISNANGGPDVPGSALCDFTGGNITMLVNTMVLGQAGSAGAEGMLTLDNGVIDVNNAILGNQQAGSGGTGVGIVNLKSNPGLGTNATLQVNGILALAAAAGPVTPGTAGSINIDGGALSAGAIVNGLGSGAIRVANGVVTVNSTAGSPSAPVSLVTLTNSVLNLAVVNGSNSMTVAALTTGGSGNVINISSAPPMNSYPAQVTLIKYSGSIAGAGYNFTIGTLPPLFAGFLSNNTANSSVDLVLTTGSGTLTWKGDISSDWDAMTPNWQRGGAVAYTDGQVVQFIDGADSALVNLTMTLQPAGITVSNVNQDFTFSGAGALAGSTPLVKKGSGALVLNNSGPNSFTGGVTIEAGTLQVGNGDLAGDLPAGAIANNGKLEFARLDSVTLANNISGSGSVVQSGNGGTLVLSGANTFTGDVVVTNNSSVKLGGGSALGSSGNVVIASGSTLDMNGNSSAKAVVVSGSGVDGTGALVNSGGPVYTTSFPSITLAGHSTFSHANRWDFSGSLNTGGNAYNLELISSGYFEWKNLAVDPALADINLTSGTMGIVGSTTLGNPSETLNIASGATLVFWGGPYSSVAKAIDFQSGATIQNAGGNNFMSGTMILEPGFCQVVISGGTTLAISNVLSGSGVLYRNGGSGTLAIYGESPSFSGGVNLYTGKLLLNGLIGSGVQGLAFDAIVAGSGTANGLVDVYGALVPGDTGVAGTFHAGGGLVLQSGAVVTNDLATSPAGDNDLVVVTGDLTMNGNTIYINPTGGALANGTYTLFTYTGDLIGSLGTATTVLPTGYTLVLNNVTTASPKRIEVTISGGEPNSLAWRNYSANGEWDLQGSANWSNLVTHAAPVQFLTLDTVLFDDSAPGTVNIGFGQIVAPSAMTVNASGNYTFSGPGQLSGSGSITKSGTGTLTFNVAGDVAGPVTVNGGTVKTASGTLGSVSSITVTNSGTFDFAGTTMTGNKPVTISGDGASGLNGAVLYNSGGGIFGNVLNLALAGDSTYGGSSRWDLGSGSVISGPHRLRIDWSGGAGYGEWDAVSVATNVVGIELASGNLGVKNMTAGFANPATVFTVNTNTELTFWSGGWNGSLHVRSSGRVNLWTGPAPIGGSNLILDEGARWFAWSGSGDQTYSCAVTLNGVAHLLIGDHNRIYTNVISGTGGLLIENWNHQMVLSAVNTYSGPTLIANGPQVALTGSGSIAQSSLIFFGGSDSSSVHVDASGRPDKTLTLASGQTLSGIGAVAGNLAVSPGATLAPAGTNTTLSITLGSNPTGRISATNDVTLNGTTTIKLNGSGNSDSVQAGGTVTYGGTLNLVNISGAPLAAGNTFTIFSAASYSGSFAEITPAAPGAGLAWDTTQLNSGQISVVSTAVQQPVIVQPAISGGNLIFSGSNGVAGGSYQVLSSTNLATPVTNWAVLGSGQFNGSGDFSFTNAVEQGQRFFILKVQ